MSELVNLFPHQERALNETYQLNRVAYYLDMGLGKTFVGSEKLWELNTPYNLVICQKSKIDDWKEHFEQFYPEYRVVIFDKQSLDIIPPESILIVNYDKVWRRPEINRLRDFTLMLDESSMIKNERSNRSKFVLQLHAKNVILLSGTPTGGKYEELISQVNLLGWNISKDLFLKQYTIREWDELDGGYKIIGYQRTERMKKKLRDHGAIFMKTEEVFDLPLQNHINVNCKCPKVYKDFAKHHMVEIDGEMLIGDTPASAKMYLRQLAGAFNKNKLNQLNDLMESTNDRLIIFYQFKRDYEAIRLMCEELKRPISTINGDVKDLDAYEKQESSVSLIQYQAGAMGLNLQKANKIIYFTLTDMSELFEQSKKRIHRIGQEKPCFYYYLLTEGTIEWRMQQVLKERKDYSDALFESEEM
ncbi:SNF2-related protein [Enterococcus sp. 2201sp1_2201st1_B8_2201SCRN_220225]|uniref:SNF2-related protein n=1 Tax=unclassified Enterococcus TaxID=2608891 RepID=UPI0034A143A7